MLERPPKTPGQAVCGWSSVVELQPSKLVMWVRFPSPAPIYLKLLSEFEILMSTVCVISSVG